MACKKRLEQTMDGQEMHCLFNLFTTEGLKFKPTWWREWFQSVVDKALRSYTPPCGADGSKLFELRQRESGPARTLLVHLPDNGHIDIDLVPVLEYTFNQLPAKVPRQKWYDELLSEEERRWLMVPKPPRDDDNLWRIHFPDAEKKLMKDLECIKPTIRLMKVLGRLRQVMNPCGPGICSLYDENLSLIPDMSVDTRKNIAQRLQKILNVVAKDSDRVCEFFLETTDDACVSSPATEENLCDPLVTSSVSATEVCETSSSPGLGSVVDGIVDERSCRIEVSPDMLEGLTVPSFLVLKQSFKAALPRGSAPGGAERSNVSGP
ncbi:hypothetical protein HPB52_010759 [Rhipicephalus sanguineus]|uniref:Mab-21-like nucleotidyltransferase domain-containing protein n=1 Tax=Rhipicephalus sanguineus TaxID=34632 RepID=A0A9D4QGF5_RHISA|nr:hypothetical protein HPB52_010759 [Rhipicephalus sanguineus]